VETTGVNLYTKLAHSVVSMDENKAAALAQEVLEKGLNVNLAITRGLIRGMETAGKRYENGEYFIPELLLCSDVFNAGLRILKPHLAENSRIVKQSNTKAVIGVVEGDTHVIGKDMVKVMLETAGFQMIDLGFDVPIYLFMEKALSEGAGLICMSSLMSTSLIGMKDAINLLEKEQVRGKFKVLVGGASVSSDYARAIGADGYAPNAVAAVRTAKKLMKKAI
jgi:dimethylamine corrinoid protein